MEIRSRLRRWIYTEHFGSNFADNYIRAIRNAGYKLIERANGSREFYNLAADPFETRNLLGRTLTTTEKSNLGTLNRQLDTLLATR